MYESTWGAGLRTLAAINCVIGVILSAIFSWGIARDYRGIFVVLFFLGLLLGVFLITAAFMTLAEIADNVVQTKTMTHELLRANEKASEAASTPVEAKKPATFNPLARLKNTPISNVENLANGWQCKKCEDKNLPAVVSCRSCGTYK